MCPRHVRFNNTHVVTKVMTELSFDEQIAQLRAKQKSHNQSESRSELIRLANSKNVTDGQLLMACYRFIGSHRPIGKRKPKVVS